MKKALICGVLGQDGSYLSELLIKKGYQVIGLHRHPIIKKYSFDDDIFKNIKHLLGNDQFIIEYGDVVDPTSLWKIITKYTPDEIYNLAAQSHVNLSFKSSEITTQVNATGTLHLLNIIIEQCPHTKFFQASSSDMYGDNPNIVLNENSRFIPNTPYGASKLFAHNLVNIYRNKYNLNASCGICFNHESPRRGENFVTQKIAKSVAKIKLGLQDKLYLGNLDVKRDWGHAKDYVEAMWLINNSDKADDYVIATGKSNSLKHYVNTIFNYADLNPEKYIEIDPVFYRKYEKLDTVGDTTKIKKELNWSNTISFEGVAKEMYESAIQTIKEEHKLNY